MNRPLRVIFVLPSFAGGGAERVALNLLSGLDRQTFSVGLVVLNGVGPLLDQGPPNIPVVDLQRSRLRFGIVPLLRELRTQRPDIVVSTMGYTNLALLANRWLLPQNCRIIIREANVPQATIQAFAAPWLARLGYRTLYRQAQAILCPSQEIASILTTSFSVPLNRLTVLPNPVDIDLIRESAASPRRHSGDGPRFVTAARLTWQKGLDRLIDMFASLPDQRAHLTVLGDGPHRAAIAAMLKEKGLGGRVTLAGFVTEPWPYYSGADAFLLASRWEGMPNAALEALAVGTPVIATPESGGLVEIATDTAHEAVVIALSGAPFVEAMARVLPQPHRNCRPSLLPSKYEMHAVQSQFSRLLTLA
jgi:glycosyltransferase involved in cell wall biosynthesis